MIVSHPVISTFSIVGTDAGLPEGSDCASRMAEVAENRRRTAREGLPPRMVYKDAFVPAAASGRQL